ncbi:oligopeptide transport system substrate-binding protein [Melghirimyces profundicolus]|uniref:Oligopeptide transport system substrate-binding protein n=1 Tax=Melghirimyces profundicolus TaxID=1242148 RepID=A0A2T6C0D9_9BACL|nr:peptide ABC transporter substrate-binding protein [Melghirimyces profundicolus]PTX61780.1 oligopeptide transport system substrate-binding protein [Melghirimyces profundicolus]
MRRNLLMMVATLLILLPILSACGRESSADGQQEITLNAQTEPPSLDPALATDTTSGWVLEHLFEGLYTKDQKGNVVKGMASEVEVSGDKKTYTFTLRKDAKWSDGSPVTAEDFEYAWKRVLSPETGSQFAFYLYYLKGAEAYNKGEGSAGDVGVEAKDDRTLVVTLEKPVAYFKELLTFWVYFPVPVDQVKKHPEKWAGNPDTLLSNGAYRLTEWKHDEELTAVKNPRYHGKNEITMDRIRWKMVDSSETAYQMFQAKELDIVTDLPAELLEKEKGKGNLKTTPYFGTYMFMLNVDKKPFNNKKIRKAFNLAIDRQSIVKNVSRGGEKPAGAFVPHGYETPGGEDFREEKTTSYVKQDVAEARKLLKEGMKEEGWKELPKVTLSYNTDENHKAIAQAVQAMLKKNLNVDVKLSNREWKVYLDTVSQRDYQMARMGWIGIFVDPVVILDYYLGDSPNNQTGWVNQEYDRLMAKAKGEQNEEKRMNLLHRAEDILMEELPFIPVYYYTQNNLIQPELKGGVVRINRYPDVRWTRWAE